MTKIKFGRIRKTGPESRVVDIIYNDNNNNNKDKDKNKKIGEFRKPSKYRWWETHMFPRPTRNPNIRMELAKAKEDLLHYEKWHIRDHLEGIVDYAGKRIKYEY